MIHVYCGEDTVTSRKAYIAALQSYKSQSYEVFPLTAVTLVDLPKGLSENISLFSEKKVFCIENIEKHGLKKSTKNTKNELYEVLLQFSKDKQVEIIDYEEGRSSRLLKLKDLAIVHESKPELSVFQFIDMCIPGNKKKFIEALQLLVEDQEPLFLFIMLSRQIRQILLAQKSNLPSKMAPWQKFKVMSAAKKWSESSLLGFYEGLIKIEIGIKSSSNPYGVARSLEILACHYL